MRHKAAFPIVIFVLILAAQMRGQESANSTEVMKQILQRLDSLEKENQQLMEEIRALRQQVNSNRQEAAAPENGKPEQPPLDERVAVLESRTAEQAQTKVEAAHKFPIQLDGMLLFNAFANSRVGYDTEEATTQYSLLSGPSRSGATLRQTLLGLDFQGPQLPGGGRVNGTVMMDFFGGYSNPEATQVRLRHADISFDWANRSFFVGQDKPLISPYQPDSLAEVGIPPLAGAGNLWLWLPQIRYEERMHLNSSNGITGQIALMQTEETYAYIPSKYADSLEAARPGLEGRVVFWHKFDDRRKFEIAPGFHLSTSHVAGASVGSHLASLNWLFIPSSHLQFSGTAFRGQNAAGLGSLGNGFTIDALGYVRPVESSGGWAQLAFPITSRLTFNIFSGLETDSGYYFSESNIVRNWTYASNFMYRLGPNVIVSLEALQRRTRSALGSEAVQNNYDLGIGYLF